MSMRAMQPDNGETDGDTVVGHYHVCMTDEESHNWLHHDEEASCRTPYICRCEQHPMTPTPQQQALSSDLPVGTVPIRNGEQLRYATVRAGHLLPWAADAVAQHAALAASHERLVAALEADAADLWEVTNAIKREIEGRSWLTEGRGPYEWDDDRYKEEAGLAFQAVLDIIAKVQPPAAKRFREALRLAREAQAPAPGRST